MKTDTRARIISLLETYQQRTRQIALLRYELKHPPHISPNEMLDAMSFARGDGLSNSKGHISNKTLYIALNYQEQTDKMNAAATDEIAVRLVELEHEQDRLEYYVSLLEQRHSDVIRLLYFEGRSWDEIAKEVGVVVRTAHKIKERAVDKLTEMYLFAESVKS